MATPEELLSSINTELQSLDASLRRDVIPVLTSAGGHGERLARLEEFRRSVEAALAEQARGKSAAADGQRQELSRWKWAALTAAISVATTLAVALVRKWWGI